jgi:A/G-specific adenine glycosylase
MSGAKTRGPEKSAEKDGRSAGFARALLAWYDRGNRDLPWRREPSAYRTLVSEFMLQQTGVATVIPYFHRFMARFPDVAALAAAPEDDVLALWSGLGYYARARRLHAAARAVVERHGGTFPCDEAALLELPGVGPYTAAAIAAIAYGVRTFALDGNAARVMARVTGDERAIDLPAVREQLRARGQALVPRERPGDFAQAVMELGATTCVASTPRCERCPVVRFCVALAEGKADKLPVRLERRAKRIVQVACVAVERRGRVLLVRRRQGLLGGTWTLPAEELNAQDSAATAGARALTQVGLAAAGPAESAGSVRHLFTHRDVTAHVVRAAALGEPTVDARWVSREELADIAVSSFTRKTLALVG